MFVSSDVSRAEVSCLFLLLPAQILTPLQCARFVYYSYPYGMDLLSLMTASAKEAGEPSTHALLRAVQPLPANTAAASHLATIDWNQAKKMAFR